MHGSFRRIKIDEMAKGEHMEKETLFFPLFVDLQQKKICVYGGGKIATRRVSSLLLFGCQIKVIAPKCSAEIEELALEKRIIYEKKAYERGRISEAYFVLAATNDKEVNLEIYQECKKKEIMVNVASDQSKSDFYFPGIIIEDSVVIGVTASGKNHTLVRKLVKKIRDLLEREKLE